MTEPRDRREALAAADRLLTSMDDLRLELADTRTYGRHNRRYIWGLVVSIVLDVALSIVVAFLAVQANEAAMLASQNQRTQKTTCLSSNEARAVSRQLWTYVLAASAQRPENQTPERKQQAEKFRLYMESAYAPRDCEAAIK